MTGKKRCFVNWRLSKRKVLKMERLRIKSFMAFMKD
jgi:hypothetical protein